MRHPRVSIVATRNGSEVVTAFADHIRAVYLDRMLDGPLTSGSNR